MSTVVAQSFWMQGIVRLKCELYIHLQLWRSKGLPQAQSLAVADQSEKYICLDVPQLLKHAPGLANQQGDQFSLFYMYYDWPGPESVIHRKEISRFVEFIWNELDFKASSYQEVYKQMRQMNKSNRDYLDYLNERYFSD